MISDFDRPGEWAFRTGISYDFSELVLLAVFVPTIFIPGVKDILAVGGYSIVDGAASPNAAMMFVTFENWDDRPVPEQHQTAILGHINKGLAEIEDGLLVALPMPSLPGLGTSAGFTYMLQDRQGSGLAGLQQAGGTIITNGNAQTGLQGLRTTFRSTAPQLRVTAQADAPYRMNPSDIEELKVPGPSGKLIPLGTVANIEEIVGPQTVTRFNLYPTIKIIGQAAPGYSSGEALLLMEDMSDKELPSSPLSTKAGPSRSPFVSQSPPRCSVPWAAS